MSSLLDNISIAAPCSVGWENMSGTDRIRFCNQCSKSVYNISAMSQSEAEKLLAEQQYAPCLSLFRRIDGTIIFDNCPIGLRCVRNHVRASIKVLSTIVATVVSCVAAMAKDDTRPSSPGTRLDWTLNENGHTEPIYEDIPPPQKFPLAQLGTPSRYSFQRKLSAEYGLSVNPSFGKAIDLSSRGKLDLAEIEFQKALAEAEKTASDPNLTEFVASEYAKLLCRKGDTSSAEKLIAKYKVPEVKTVTTISK
jgi:hypothetical protein